MDEAEQVVTEHKRKRIEKGVKRILRAAKKKKRTTKREHMVELKRDFENFLDRIVPEKKKAQAYVKQVKDTSIEDWVVQMKSAVWPLVAFGFVETIMTKILEKAELTKEDLYFQNVKYVTDEEKGRDAGLNYRDFVSYLESFARECKKLA